MEENNQEILNNSVRSSELNQVVPEMQKSFNVNDSYVAIKRKFNLLMSTNVLPILNSVKNNGYGKLLVAFVALLTVIFGYITLAFLQSLYFVGCAINSVRALKNDSSDLKPVVSNWVTYSTVALIFAVLDLLSYMTGDMLKIVFDTCKLTLLMYLYNSEEVSTNLNYGMMRIYSCNNRVIDTTQNGVNSVIGYVHQSCNKENFEEIIQSVKNATSKISKDKTN